MTTAHTITPDLIGRTVSIEVKRIAAMGDKAKSNYLDLPGTHVGVVRYYFEDQEGTITLHFDDKSNAVRVHPGLQDITVRTQGSDDGPTVSATPQVGQELTATELDALPLWSIVVDEDGDAMQKRLPTGPDDQDWCGAGYNGVTFGSLELAGSTLLHIGNWEKR